MTDYITRLLEGESVEWRTLCESITEGLPREIELRRRQYEYYREQLLTFPQS